MNEPIKCGDSPELKKRTKQELKMDRQSLNRGSFQSDVYESRSSDVFKQVSKNSIHLKSSVNLTPSIDAKLQELCETNLPIPPAEMNVREMFEQANCDNKMCRTMHSNMTERAMNLC